MTALGPPFSGGRPLPAAGISRHRWPYFVVAVLGFSFWFLVAVPFASHRETYWWLAMVTSEPFEHALSSISSSYRPLFQVATWLAYGLLDPHTFPTRESRQLVLQLGVYLAYLWGWWLIFSAAREYRSFAVVALVVGAVYFSGYVQLFHVYGIAYAPVLMLLGWLLKQRGEAPRAPVEWTGASAAIALALWHPFATALFVAFYSGYVIDTRPHRARRDRIRAAIIVGCAAFTLATMLVVVPRLWADTSALLVETAQRPLSSRFAALIVSYQTNEVNAIAAVVSLALTLVTLSGMRLSPRLLLLGRVVAVVAGMAMFAAGLPLLLLWIGVCLLKLVRMRDCGLLLLMAATVVLPLGSGIGSPVHGLFAIVVAAFTTALGSQTAERAIASPRAWLLPLVLPTIALVAIVGLRAGIPIPIVTGLATPLLAERERTYQLEEMLAWLRDSPQCSRQIEFAERAGNPVEGVASALSRRTRPPASQDDVRLYWNKVLRCDPPAGRIEVQRSLVLTFGERPATEPLYIRIGSYAGPAAIVEAGQR